MATSNYVANFNLTSWANAQAQLNSGNAQDVTIPIMDENGNITDTTVPNRGRFQQRVWDDVGGALGQFNRTFYVDAENGDDNNDGSSNNPFKTLQKATTLAPGAYIRVNLLSDYVLTQNEYIGVANNTIEIHAGNHQINLPEDNRYLFYIGKNSFVNIFFENVTDKPCILIENEDTSDIYKSLFVLHIYEAYASMNGGLRISFKNCDGVDLIKTKNKGVFCSTGSIGWMNRSINMHFEIVLVLCDDSNIVFDNWICDYSNSTGTFSYSTVSCDNITFKNNNGDGKNVMDTVAGIVKDSDGKPRNILSDIIF